MGEMKGGETRLVNEDATQGGKRIAKDDGGHVGVRRRGIVRRRRRTGGMLNCRDGGWGEEQGAMSASRKGVGAELQRRRRRRGGR